MSRKGNSLDNGLMESFFGIIKSEMFYGQEKNYKDIEELKLAIEEYIDYYNNKRIKVKLKGLTPAKYRNQSLLIWICQYFLDTKLSENYEFCFSY